MSRSLGILTRTVALTACLAVGSGAAFGQTAGPIGSRTVKSYWIENAAFLAITPATPFDNPAGCGSSAMVIVPASNAASKQILAAVIHAMATNTPVSGWAVGCYTYWGQTFPSVHALGVGG